MEIYRLSPRRRRDAILTLHDVRNGRWLRGMLQALARRARFVDLGSLVERHRRGEGGRGELALTFDDGNKSIRTIVEPVCTELRIPFATFVCGEFVTGRSVPWFERAGALLRRVAARPAAHYWAIEPGLIRGAPDLFRALKTLPHDEVLLGLDRAEAAHGADHAAIRARYMDMDDLRAVAGNPLVTVGSHAHRHPILANLALVQQAEEIEAGLEAIRPVCPHVTLFAYPNGKPEDYDAHVMQVLRKSGIVAAVTTVQRPLLAGDDMLQLPRLGVGEGESAERIERKWALPWVSIGDLRERAIRARVRAYRRISA
jgi:peptidoglycan/xylan/chitin deacetylase (PgdA/CDA1 family)